MLTPWEIKKKEYLPPMLMMKMNLLGTFSLIKILLMNLGTIKAVKNQEKKNIYVRPKPTYVIPKYEKEMKFCNLDEKYLRPTLYCNSHAPEIIALANKLGAYKKSDYEFAQSAFEFAKRKIILEFVPLDGVEQTLQRGTGTCLHKISVFIALCRAAGIKARYKFFALTMLDEWMQPALNNAPLMKQWYDVMGFFLLHGEGEVFIDGKWIPGDVGAEPERQASAGLPVTKLGEDSIGLWLFPVPGTIIRRESIPLGL
ncbi:MAG: transglutaminase family protein, partial [Candidatus Thermoplasmatota archaeon]|nr:transglutaminase family protein [Candidatus Thermoplasmatota archaeon]